MNIQPARDTLNVSKAEFRAVVRGESAANVSIHCRLRGIYCRVIGRAESQCAGTPRVVTNTFDLDAFPAASTAFI